MSKSLKAIWDRHRNSLRQFVRFGIVGGSGVLVNMVVAVLLHRLNGGTPNGNDPLFGIPFTEFNVRYRHFVWIAGFLVANLTNFQLNRSWTFKSAKHAGWFKEFWPFLAVGSVAAFLGLFILTAFTHPGSPVYLPDPYFNEAAGFTSREYWAQLFTIVITTPINFVVNKVWTFRAVRGHHGTPEAGIDAHTEAPRPVDEPTPSHPATAGADPGE